jgi:serine/threonine protein kinase
MEAASLFPEIPGYTLKSVLGTGGFATVFLARQQSLEREVALKIMDPNLAVDPGIRKRFLREARDTAEVCDHPNIVTIFDIGQTPTHIYIAMQYLPGTNLKQLLDGCVPIKSPVTIALRIAAALEHAHSRGLVHRDIKPGNILFNRANEAMLSDFGIARKFDHNTHVTQLGNILGTARYMSPEQAQGDPEIDGRSDLYSLGVVIFELLAQEPPYQSTNPMALLRKHLNDPIPKLPTYHRQMQPVVNKLLAKSPEHRYQSAQELITDLETTPENQAIEINSALKKPNVPPADRSVLPLGLGSIVMLISVIFYLNLQQSQNQIDIECKEITELQISSRDHLLEVAALHETVGRTNHPPGANALEAYTKALNIDPCSQPALEALDRLKNFSTSSD